MSGRISPRAALIVTFVGGVGLMIPFESTVTRVLGMTLLFAFAIIGVFLIAAPGFLTRDEEN